MPVKTSTIDLTREDSQRDSAGLSNKKDQHVTERIVAEGQEGQGSKGVDVGGQRSSTRFRFTG